MGACEKGAFWRDGWQLSGLACGQRPAGSFRSLCPTYPRRPAWRPPLSPPMLTFADPEAARPGRRRCRCHRQPAPACHDAGWRRRRRRRRRCRRRHAMPCPRFASRVGRATVVAVVIADQHPEVAAAAGAAVNPNSHPFKCTTPAAPAAASPRRIRLCLTSTEQGISTKRNERFVESFVLNRERMDHVRSRRASGSALA